MISMQAAWWVEYVCRHGTANWLKSIGEEVTRNDGDDWEEVIIETAVRYLTFWSYTLVALWQKFLVDHGDQVPFYQHHHLDIIIFLAILIVIFITATFFFWRTVFR